MAAPNIVNVSAIYGKVVTADLTSTSAISVLSNAASSGKVFKIDSLIVSNIDTVNAFNITINHYSAAALSGTATPIASTISVPANASLIVIDKTTMIYLEENMSIGATAGTANKLKVICSYEDIS
jgi:hypothetical protein